MTNTDNTYADFGERLNWVMRPSDGNFIAIYLGYLFLVERGSVFGYTVTAIYANQHGQQVSHYGTPHSDVGEAFDAAENWLDKVLQVSAESARRAT